MPERKEKITISYERDPTTQTVPVTGAIGGATPDGHAVVVHAYAEYAAVPNYTEHAVEPDGRIDLTKGSDVSRSDVSRRIVTTLVMTPEAAAGLGHFLVKNAEEAIRRRNPKQ